jgi:gliding motility-associated-like protein
LILSLIKVFAWDSVIFNAGSGFASYQWSNGQLSQNITVTAMGSYMVVATTAEGCKSYDTVQVTNVFPDPLINLDHNSSLCTGDNRTLDAGSFISYLWNNGSTSRTITISDTGLYAVKVIDNNGCKGADTTIITSIFSSPSGFLPADTVVCSYGTLDIRPIKNFSNYRWSNHAITSVITISRPGTYWLQVTDDNNCKGRDSIIVNPKECLKGFYIPTAFTPNNDGGNDVYKPLLFGIVKKYQFTIYNRLGEKVFQSIEPGKGWNGPNAGSQQDTNIFIWVCSYQLAGEVSKVKKGTVVLIR